MTPKQHEDLAFAVSQGGISIYTPTQRSLDRWGPLQDLGLVRIEEREINGGQETMLRVLPTEAGRKALIRSHQRDEV